MTAILKVDTIQDTAGNNIINESSDTITIGASGDTIALAGTTVTGITQGITEADMFRLTANISATDADITSNLERVDDASFAKIGNGMSLSSGIFTFPSTGLYQVTAHCTFQINSADLTAFVGGKVTTNNSSYTDVFLITSGYEGSNSKFEMDSNSCFVNVTNTSNVKMKFNTSSFASGTLLLGNTGYNRTNFTFIRLGDST